MPVRIKKVKAEPLVLPEGVTLVPVKSEYKEHYNVYAENKDYPNRTEIGNVKKTGEGHFVVEVSYREWAAVSGFRVCDKSFGAVDARKKEAAVWALYNHRMNLRKQGLIKV